MRLIRPIRPIFFLFSAFLVAGALIFLFSYLSPKTVEAAWYDPAWNYRKTITITNSSGGALTDFQVSFTIDTTDSTKFQSDCDDIRVTDSNGALLSYWIDVTGAGCNNSATKIWTKVSSIPTTGATVYVYYGNPAATAASNGDNVFVFFDDFSSGTVDTNKWTTSGSIQSGRLVFTSSAGVVPAVGTDHVVEGNINVTGDYPDFRLQVLLNASSGCTSGGYVEYLIPWFNTDARLDLFNSGGGCTYTQHLQTGGNLYTNYNFKVTTYVSGGTAYFSAVNTDNSVTFLSANSSSDTSGNYIRFFNDTSATDSLDNVRIRKYASTEPTTALSSEEQAPGSPIAYWKFDDSTGTNAQDSTTNNNDGTLAGTTVPAWKTEDLCIFGKCLFFDGSTSNVTVANAINGIQTVSMWIKPNSVTSSALIDLDGGTHTITVSSGTISAGGFSSPTIYVNGKVSSTLTANVWQYVTVTTATSFNSTSSLTIGKSSTTFLQGFIDDVKIYNYARSAAQIKTDLVAQGNDGSGTVLGAKDQKYLSDGLVGYWKMDESSGNPVDSSGNSTTLTNNGTATFTTGKYGNGTSVDGSSQYFSAADNTALSVTGDLTLSSWIKPSANTADTQYDITGKWDGANTSYLLAQYGDEIRLYLNSSSNYVTTDAANLATSTWYHILATYSASTQTVKIFVNGVQQAATTTGTIPSSITDNAGSLYIGVDKAVSGTLTLQPDATAGIDTDLDAVAPDTNGGTDAYYAVGSGVASIRYKQLTKFDLSTLVGTTISSATLTLTLYSSGDGLSDNWYISRILSGNSAWTESTATWNNQTTGTPWAGSAGASTAGTDYSSTSLWSCNCSPSTTNGEVNFTLDTTEFALMVANNYGFIHSFDAWSRYRFYRSSDYGTAGERPKLVVDYFSLGNYFNGQIDEARVYNRTLSPKEVSDLYNFAPGPVGYWKMAEGSGTTISDSSGNSNTSSAFTNNVSWVNGKYGGGLDFDGTNDVVRIPETSSTDLGALTDSYTVSAWICARGNGIIVAKSTAAGSPFRFSVSGGGSILFFQLYGGGYPSAGGTTNLVSNTCTWHHVAGVRDVNTDTLYAYVDGRLEGSGNDTTTGSLASNDDISIGNGGTSYTETDFNGKIDEVKIYNYARTQKQIIEDMNAGHPAVGSPVSSSVAYWKFDEGALNKCPSGGGTDFCDSGPYINDLTFSTTSGGWTDSGKFGKALNGTGAVWASRSDDADFDVSDTDDYSVSLWFKSDTADISAIEYLFDKASATLAGYSIYANADDTICFGIDDDTTWGPDISSCTSTDLYDATWHHLVAVRDHTGADKTLLYIDGILKDSDADTTSASLANNQTLYIGDSDGTDNGDEFTGDFDEVKVYRYALTADEIKIEYNRGQSIQLGAAGNNSTYAAGAANQEYCVPGDTTSCTNPLLEWRLEEKKSTTVFDTSGNGNNGTINSLNTRVFWAKKGKIGGALLYDGSATTGTQTRSSSSITPPTQVTFEAWLYPTSYGGGGAGVGQIFNFSSSTGYFLITEGGATNAYRWRSIHATNGRWYTPVNSITLNAWQHIAVSYDASSTSNVPSIYLNGILQTNTSVTNPVGSWTSTAANVDIGGNPSSGVTFGGIIDEVKIYNYIRTPAQIAWDYNKGKPVGHWKFDECSGSSVNDSSGNSYTGTITIGASGEDTVGACTTSSTAWGDGVTGKRNYSLKLDGTDDFVTTAAFSPLSSAALTTTTFSWGGWFYPTTSAASKTLLEKATEFQLTTNASSQPICGIYYSGAFNNSAAPTTALTLSSWNHVLCTYDGTNINTYLNGKLIKQHAETNSVAAVSSILYMGETSTATNEYEGQLDEVKIWNYALTATQVKNEYNNGAINYTPLTGSP